VGEKGNEWEGRSLFAWRWGEIRWGELFQGREGGEGSPRVWCRVVLAVTGKGELHALQRTLSSLMDDPRGEKKEEEFVVRKGDWAENLISVGC